MIRAICLATLLAIAVGSSRCSAQNAASAQSSATNEQISSIAAVVGQVKQALAGVQTTLANANLPPLKQVKLALQTVATKKGGASLKLWVITISRTWEKREHRKSILF